MGEALRAPCSAPLNPVRPAGALGSRVREASLRLAASVVVGATPGGARFVERERQKSETPVGLSQPTAQMVRTHVALAATFEPSGES
jgi:hypothetical protein